MAADDLELLRAWRDGDDAAGQTLVRRHIPAVHRFFASKVSEGIEDLVQGTFLACVESRDRFEERSSFRTYVLAIARLRLLQHLRKTHRGVRAAALERAAADYFGGSPSQDTRVRQELRLLLESLRRIPLDLQIAVELHYWEEMTTAEIAEVLDIPRGTVKTRLVRARDQLRTEVSRGGASETLIRSTLDNFERWARDLRDVTPTE